MNSVQRQKSAPVSPRATFNPFPAENRRNSLCEFKQTQSDSLQIYFKLFETEGNF